MTMVIDNENSAYFRRYFGWHQKQNNNSQIPGSKIKIKINNTLKLKLTLRYS